MFINKKLAFSIPLLIICRKEDYRNNIELINKYNPTKWLSIQHLNSNQLDLVYHHGFEKQFLNLLQN